MLRVLLGVNVMALAAALIQVPEPSGWVARYVEMAALVEPLLLLALGLLAAVRDLLRRIPLRLGQPAVVVMVGGLAFAQNLFWQSLGFGDSGNAMRPALLAVAQCRALADSRPAAASRGGARILVRPLPRRDARPR